MTFDDDVLVSMIGVTCDSMIYVDEICECCILSYVDSLGIKNDYTLENFTLFYFYTILVIIVYGW